MTIRQLLDDRLTTALHLAGAPDSSSAQVRPSARPEFGDYQANGVMAAAKQAKLNPRDLAAKILDNLDLSDVADKVEIAGPGFLNIHLKNNWLAEQLGSEKAFDLTPQKIVVDYSSPNLAKEMHVGHLRSTIIGDAMVRVLEWLGHQVIRQNHVGDWGTQFGMLLAHLADLKAQGDEISMQLHDLESFYRAAKLRFDAEPAFAQRARDMVVKLQSGDVECLALWHQFIEISLSHSEETYQHLGVSLNREHVKAESSYNPDLANIVSALQSKGLLTESDGAQCVFLDEFRKKDGSIDPIIIQKTGGGFLYATTDLAALRYRNDILKADRILYFVDVRQSLHFQQMFALARKAGFVDAHVLLEHMAFGTMLGEDGKPFKTRTGGTVRLADLLKEAEERAFSLVSDKSPELDEAERREIARKVGIGSVKYADLSKNRNSDYVFSWNAMLSLEGNTAPYLQYAYARIRSIFRKLGREAPEASIQLQESSERALALRLLQFDEVLLSVAKDGLPNQLCLYLYELAGNFMSFYEACPILKDDVPRDSRDSRLKLADLTAQTLKQGLGLLGIEVMERM
ncbi:arginine--tRNA ligase [Thiolinea disciformis]|uniref:arginine--tRNA ligase n=1 Tax=Thiolinea disciformis TaxID=125614 RepID=UPI000377EAF6|nr:arginine--tRNA ligase [Thiolinea disciformis]